MDANLLFLGAAAGTFVVAVGVFKLTRAIYSLGFRNGRDWASTEIMRMLKYHKAKDGLLHEIGGQFRPDIDAVVINTANTRPLGFGTYLYVALHEYYHSQFHNDMTPEVEAEISSHAFAMAAVKDMLDVMVAKKLITAKEAVIPEFYTYPSGKVRIQTKQQNVDTE